MGLLHVALQATWSGNAGVLLLAATSHISVQASHFFVYSFRIVRIYYLFNFILQSGKFEYCCSELQNLSFLNASLGKTDDNKRRCGQKKVVVLLKGQSLPQEIMWGWGLTPH